eukprot:10963882-Alexandrium_andersonii.AAC.1
MNSAMQEGAVAPEPPPLAPAARASPPAADLPPLRTARLAPPARCGGAHGGGSPLRERQSGGVRGGGRPPGAAQSGRCRGRQCHGRLYADRGEAV